MGIGALPVVLQLLNIDFQILQKCFLLSGRNKMIKYMLQAQNNSSNVGHDL